MYSQMTLSYFMESAKQLQQCTANTSVNNRTPPVQAGQARGQHGEAQACVKLLLCSGNPTCDLPQQMSMIAVCTDSRQVGRQAHAVQSLLWRPNSWDSRSVHHHTRVGRELSQGAKQLLYTHEVLSLDPPAPI